MADNISDIIFRGIDKVSDVANRIAASVKKMTYTSKDLGTQFNKVSSSAGVVANRLKYLGLAVAGVGASVFYLSERTSDMAEQLLNASKKTGLSVEALQKLNYVTDQAGVSVDALAGGFKFLNKSIADAATSADSEAGQAFASMGIDVRGANGELKKTEQIFYEISDAFSKSDNVSAKVATSMKLLGRAGSELIPVLDEGSDAIKKQGLDFEKYGNMLDEKALEAMKDFGDTAKNVRLALAGLGSIIAQAVIPVLQPLVEKFALWIASHKELIKIKVADFIITMTKVMSQFWPVVTHGIGVIGDLVNKLGGVMNIVKVIAAFIAVDLVASFLQLGVAILNLGKIFLLTPFGLVLASLAAIGYVVFKLSGKTFPEFADAVVGTVGIMADKIGALFKTIWDGVESVLAALDLIDKKKEEQDKKKGGIAFTTTIGEDGKAHTVKGGTAPAGLASVGLSPTPDLGAAPAGDTGFQGILSMISGMAESAKKQMEINVNLNTANEVSYVDIDAPMNSNVNVNSGPMVAY